MRPLKPVQVISKAPAASNKPMTQLAIFETLSNLDDDDNFDTMSMKPTTDYHNVNYPTNIEIHTDPILVEEKDPKFQPRTSTVARSKKSMRSKMSMRSRKDYDTMSMYDKYSVIISTNDNYNCFHR